MSQALIKEKAAACVDIMPVQSVYAENGGVKETGGALMIVKTIDAKAGAVEAMAKEFESEPAPCIASFTLYRMNREFKDWLAHCLA